MKIRSTAAVAAMLLVACGGGHLFVARDLAGIMPSAVDAPAGTQIDAETAGPKTIDGLVTDADVKIRLSQLGFRVAYSASFATPNYVPDREKAPLGSAFYGTLAILLEGEGNAARGFEFYSQRLRARAKGLTPIIPKETLGDEEFSFRFSELDDTPLEGLAILWRRGNALFSVVGVGNPSPDPAVIRGLAGKIDGRAAAL